MKQDWPPLVYGINALRLFGTSGDVIFVSHIVLVKTSLSAAHRDDLCNVCGNVETRCVMGNGPNGTSAAHRDKWSDVWDNVGNDGLLRIGPIGDISN